MSANATYLAGDVSIYDLRFVHLDSKERSSRFLLAMASCFGKLYVALSDWPTL